MIKRVPQTINGKFVGVWYHFDDGRILYLSHQSGERPKGLNTKYNAWYMDVSTLREAERRGCEFVGVLHRLKGKKLYYMARLEDWTSPVSSAGVYKSMAQRLLPLSKFPVNPSMDRELINSNMRIR